MPRRGEYIRYYNNVPAIRYGYDLYDVFTDVSEAAQQGALPILQGIGNSLQSRRDRLEANLYGDDVVSTQQYSQNINRDMPILTNGGAEGNSGGAYAGSLVQNVYGRSKWGKPGKKNTTSALRRLAEMTTTSSVYRFQSLSKYDNMGHSSIPLWVTETGQTANTLNFTGTGTGVVATSNYNALWLPFFVFNLTSLPQGNISSVASLSLPMYQLGKETNESGACKYVWRSCYGMNNNQPQSVTGGLSLAGGMNSNPITRASQCMSMEWTNATTNDLTTANDNYDVWQHVYSKVKLLINGVPPRNTTFRTGVMSFPCVDAAPRRQYIPLSSLTTAATAPSVIDTNTEDLDIINPITIFWDQYWNTKANHPLASVRRNSRMKPVKFHKFEKFTIGPDTSINLDANGIQLRKDIVIGTQGRFKGMREELYVAENTAGIFDKNAGNQTIAAEVGNLTGYTIAVAGNQATLANDGTGVATNYPNTSTTPIANFGNGAQYPVFAPAKYSTVFTPREKDKWFFIQADYFMPASAMTKVKPASGQVWPLDIGVPGTDACYANIIANTAGFGGSREATKWYLAPPTFDFTIESKFNMHKVLS